jgi:hypothetical protein
MEQCLSSRGVGSVSGESEPAFGTGLDFFGSRLSVNLGMSREHGSISLRGNAITPKRSACEFYLTMVPNCASVSPETGSRHRQLPIGALVEAFAPVVCRSGSRLVVLVRYLCGYVVYHSRAPILRSGPPLAHPLHLVSVHT